MQLEEKLKEKIDAELSEKIDLVNEQDLFHSYVLNRGRSYESAIHWIVIFQLQKSIKGNDTRIV